MARVLIGVDGSALSHGAAHRALELLGSGHQVTVVQVVRPVTPLAMAPTSTIGGGIVGDPAMEVSVEPQVDRAQEDVAATARGLGGDVTTRVVVGDPGAELCRIAEDERFDLLVVGSHGSGFLKRVLLGSVSHHVLHHAPCPVLVIRDIDGAEAPLEETS